MKQFLNAHNCLFALKSWLFAAIVSFACLQHSVAAPSISNTMPPEFELVGMERMQDGHWQFALHINLSQGWKTYWTEPGPFGIPPLLSVERGQNTAAVELQLPEPYLGQDAYGSYIGYSRPASFIVALAPVEQNKPLSGTLVLTYGICSDICVPARQEFSFELPDNDSGNWQPGKVQAARSKMPRPEAFITEIKKLDETRFELTSSIKGDAILAIGSADLKLSQPEKVDDSRFVFSLSANESGKNAEVRFYLLTGFGGFFQDITLPQ